MWGACVQERTIIKSSEWREQIQAVDRDCLQHLRKEIAGGFDEERFGSCIGFGNLKRCLACVPDNVAFIITTPQQNLNITHRAESCFRLAL